MSRMPLHPSRAEPVALSTTHRGGRSPIRPLGAVRWLVRAIRRWRRREQAIAELARLDDKTLADIGLHRSEIRSAVIDEDEPNRPSERRRCR